MDLPLVTGSEVRGAPIITDGPSSLPAKRFSLTAPTGVQEAVRGVAIATLNGSLMTEDRPPAPSLVQGGDPSRNFSPILGSLFSSNGIQVVPPLALPSRSSLFEPQPEDGHPPPLRRASSSTLNTRTVLDSVTTGSDPSTMPMSVDSEGDLALHSVSADSTGSLPSMNLFPESLSIDEASFVDGGLDCDEPVSQ